MLCVEWLGSLILTFLVWIVSILAWQWNNGLVKKMSERAFCLHNEAVMSSSEVFNLFSVFLCSYT